ncbi:hypothetical protein TRFO_23673 [Tritrichomonas foetus]|uniref:G domain-containing protein n=1 Tax=Tritrichomonas foetus TaxID=1144522 RepID=A0A1J4KEC4_9EUKA|nr:hypothetical protein TRFO_23673 [Tritrichomonas foetus]|eukprot:OHT07974.1 hypothetical protein TRFO_23673 [Tritrichomonas foetus]
MAVLVFGKGGVGKSTLGNYYLGLTESEGFEVGKGTEGVTRNPEIKSNRANTKQFTDTEGFDDKAVSSNDIAEKLGKFMRQNSYEGKPLEKGINAIVLVINGSDKRISGSLRDLLIYSYKALNNPEVINHICVVLSHWPPHYSEKTKNEKKDIFIKGIEEIFADVSKLDNLLTIPFFFVDFYLDCPESISLTKKEMEKFTSWVSKLSKLSVSNFRETGYNEETKREDKKVEVGSYYTKRGNGIFQKYKHYTKITYIPNNGEPERYSVRDSYIDEEKIGTCTPEYRDADIPSERPFDDSSSQGKIKLCKYVQPQKRYCYTFYKGNNSFFDEWENNGCKKKVLIETREFKTKEKSTSWSTTESNWFLGDKKNYYRKTWTEGYWEITNEITKAVSCTESVILPHSTKEEYLGSRRDGPGVAHFVPGVNFITIAGDAMAGNL